MVYLITTMKEKKTKNIRNGLNKYSKIWERIGKFQESKQRPLKVNLKNTEDKKSFFKKLRNLKGNKTYLSISVTEDYTIAERGGYQNMVK